MPLPHLADGAMFTLYQELKHVSREHSVGNLATEISCTLDQVCQQVEEASAICSCRTCGLGVQQRPGGDTTVGHSRKSIVPSLGLL